MTGADERALLAAGETTVAAPEPALRETVARTAHLMRPVPWALCLIVAAAAALRLSELDSVAANQFYDAAVRSMTLSWHNFFFGAFDPGAFLSVDKTPLDLWLQVASVKLFGFNQTALKLPEALAGTLAVPLLYDATRRGFGQAAGLAAATVLAVLPESVLTSRSDTMDSVMMLLVVAALWLVVRSLQTGRRWHIVLAGAALGVAFNIKLFEALIPAPAVLLLYAIGSAAPLRRRAADLALSIVALIGVGLSWAVIVSLSPGSHPWPIGSTDGSVWNVMFVFNGFGRVASGEHGRTGGPGLLRLLQGNSWHYDILFGCVLVAAVALGTAAALSAAVRRRRIARSGATEPGGDATSVPAAAPARAPLAARALVSATAVWIAVSYAVFSHAPTVHTRYLESVAPALALAIGTGVARLTGLVPWESARGRPAALALAVALAGTCAYLFALRPVSIAWGAVAVAVAAIGATLMAKQGGRIGHLARWLAAILAVAVAVLYPVRESLHVVQRHSSNSLGLLTYPDAYQSMLSSYLQPRTAGIRYEVVVDEPLALAPLIIHDRRPILPLTSFKGIRAVRLAELRAAIDAGEARYALVGRHVCSGPTDRNAACVPAARWIRAHGIDVSADAGVRGGHALYLLLPSA